MLSRGVYRKRPAGECSATTWSDEELRQRLDRRLSFLAEKKESFKYSTRLLLRKVKENSDSLDLNSLRQIMGKDFDRLGSSHCWQNAI